MDGRLTVVRGDIVEQRVDAIVNAANEALMPGGGVCGAIHRAAGPMLYHECRRIGHCATGDAVITKGYELPAPWVIHTVGPVWDGGDHGEPEQLASAYRNSLKLAAERGLKTVAFPLLSAGVYGYPMDAAARVAMDEAAAFLRANDSLDEVRFVAFDDRAFAALSAARAAALGG